LYEIHKKRQRIVIYILTYF